MKKIIVVFLVVFVILGNGLTISAADYTSVQKNAMIMELSISTAEPSNLHDYSVDINHCGQYGSVVIYLLSYDNIIFTPSLFWVDVNGVFDASADVEEIRYFLDGNEYDTSINGELGEFDFWDLWPFWGTGFEITVEADLTGGSVLSYSFFVTLNTIIP